MCRVLEKQRARHRTAVAEHRFQHVDDERLPAQNTVLVDERQPHRTNVRLACPPNQLGGGLDLRVIPERVARDEVAAPDSADAL
jgi:hypothetical protein